MFRAELMPSVLEFFFFFFFLVASHSFQLIIDAFKTVFFLFDTIRRYVSWLCTFYIKEPHLPFFHLNVNNGGSWKI